MLLSYQKENLEKLNSALKIDTNLTIVGKENSGRKYTIEQWSKNIKKSLIINLKKTELNCEYAALVSELKKICQIGKQKIGISPNIAFTVSAYTIGIGLTINDDGILKSEKTIKKCLNRLAKKYTLIFIIDTSLCISDQSIELVDSFVTHHKGRKPIYKFTLSIEATDENKCVYFESLSDSKINKYETLKKLNLNPEIRLTDKALEFIFQNVSDNIGLLVKIVNDINSYNLDCNFEKFDINNITKTLLDESFKNYEYSVLLGKILTLYAISHYYFQIIDLAYLLNKSEHIIDILLEFALNHYLLEVNTANYHIIFGLVKKIYGELDEISKHQIYLNITKMFSDIYPSDYYNKYIFADLAKSPEKGTYLVQYLLQKIRLNHDINISDYRNSLTKDEFSIVKNYNCAFGLLSMKKYKECMEKLNTLNDLSGALLYEVNIIKSQCLIRKIDKLKRKRSLDILSYNNSNNAIDENLKFRLDIRKIAAFIHVGKYKEALITCDDVKERLIKMYSKTHSLEYRYYLNVIYRKYSYVCEYDLSINEVEKSVDFFRVNKEKYYKGFYISLNNLLSLYIINMKLEKAEKIKQEIEDLKITKNNISFPRREIEENNFILYHFFSKKISVQEALTEFGKLYNETKETADYIFLASNYAVFMMLNHDLVNAREILMKEFNNVKEEEEGVYYYRIAINLSICEFLLDNTKKIECLHFLESVNYNQEDPHYEVRNAELNGIINLMKSISKCNDAVNWCKQYKANISTVLNFYTTYQQGLVFTTLFNWDDD